LEPAHGIDTIRGAARRAAHPIAYDAAFLEAVLDYHSGAEALPGYAGWIHDHMGGRVVEFRGRLLPQILAFTDLHDQDVLDFGCGTGSTTVVLAEAAPSCRVTGLDIDAAGLEIARARLRHHGLLDRVELRRVDPVGRAGDLPLPDASFDFVLANGVLEHVVPFAARPQVVLEMWRLLRPGGRLFVSETPSPLWPVDRHTTGLPLIPWLPSGAAARLAIAFGKHRSGADLDARGRRGMSYWEVVRPLKRAGERFEVLNVTETANRLLPAGPGPGARPGLKRRLGTFVLESVAGKPLAALGIPAVALGPFLEFLCLRKLAARPAARVEPA
jgi:SAM-dependent methyltransferase